MSDTEKDYEAIALAALTTARPEVVATVMGGPQESLAARVAAFGRGWDEAEQARQPATAVEPEEEIQQPGTHRVTVSLEWQETNTYKDEVEIDVPDDFDGDVADLLHPDDHPDWEYLGLPEGFQTHWLDRAAFDPDSVDDREFILVIVVD